MVNAQESTAPRLKQSAKHMRKAIAITFFIIIIKSQSRDGSSEEFSLIQQYDKKAF